MCRECPVLVEGDSSMRMRFALHRYCTIIKPAKELSIVVGAVKVVFRLEKALFTKLIERSEAKQIRKGLLCCFF